MSCLLGLCGEPDAWKAVAQETVPIGCQIEMLLGWAIGERDSERQLLGSANAETTPQGTPAVAAVRTQRPDAARGGKKGGLPKAP